MHGNILQASATARIFRPLEHFLIDSPKDIAPP
jgi:hypothetical protein